MEQQSNGVAVQQHDFYHTTKKHYNMKKEILCKCGSSQRVETVERFSNNSLHIRGTCLECKSFIQWIPYSESYLIKNFLLSTLGEQHAGKRT